MNWLILLILLQTGNPSATRLDFARAYHRLELAFEQHPPDGQKLIEINKAVDRAVIASFTASYLEAVETLDKQTVILDPAIPPALLTYRATLEPSISVQKQAAFVNVHLQSLYSVAGADLPVQIILRNGKDPIAEHKLALKHDGDEWFDLYLPKTAQPGRYELQAEWAQDKRLTLAIWHLVAKSPSETGKANEVALKSLKPTPSSKGDIAAVLARNRLLTDTPSTNAELVANPIDLAGSIEKEIAALREGKNPFQNHSGDTWRIVMDKDVEVPIRVYAPKQVGKTKPMPLIIAIPGTGGDENVFFNGYGNGIIKKLADKRGALVASLALNSIIRNPELFDKIVALLAGDYPVDRSRIYVIGHSAGGGVAGVLARTHAYRITAVCCISGGGGFATSTKLAPTLVVAGDQDGIVDCRVLEAAANRAKIAGLPIEYRLASGYGHMLIVGSKLPMIFDWLLQHHRP